MSEEKKIEPNASGEAKKNSALTNKSATPQQPKTINDKPETDNMEVQKHPHHVMHKKKWPEYFLEFLMLFLAVFLGFIAENIREHKVEQERGRQYIHSFRQDLMRDTLECSLSTSELTGQISILNNMASCFKIINENPNATGCLKNIILNSTGFTDFIYTDRTIQQLKNAGGLRLIEDKEIADSIITYDATVRAMQIHQGVLENLQQNAKNAHNGMIDYLHLDNLMRSDNADTLFLLTKDKVELNKYFNTVRDFKAGLGGQLRWMLYIKNEATRLLDMLDKKGYK